MIHVSDLEDELDRSSVIHSSKLIIANIDGRLEEDDEMLLDNRKKGLRDSLRLGGRCPRTPQGLSLPFIIPLFLILQLTHLLLPT